MFGCMKISITSLLNPICRVLSSSGRTIRCGLWARAWERHPCKRRFDPVRRHEIYFLMFSRGLSMIPRLGRSNEASEVFEIEMNFAI